jgi:pimeloyl-ACP methyl ester carboxylesterase
MPFFQSRGMKLHYETAGSGRPILMIHGFTNHGMVWTQQITDLIHAGYRVILPDLAGHGLSQVAEKTTTVDDLTLDMVNLLDHLGVGQTSVCGLSLGGMVGHIWRPRIPRASTRWSWPIHASTAPHPMSSPPTNHGSRCSRSRTDRS